MTILRGIELRRKYHAKYINIYINIYINLLDDSDTILSFFNEFDFFFFIPFERILSNIIK